MSEKYVVEYDPITGTITDNSGVYIAGMIGANFTKLSDINGPAGLISSEQTVLQMAVSKFSAKELIELKKAEVL